MKNWLFVLAQATRQLWVRVAAYSVLGLVAAGAAAVFGHLVPIDVALTIGTEAVDQVLSILASSMLAVATFSLATLVTAYTAVAATATPRAAKLMLSDGRGQGSLATFVGAFIYAVVGIFVLQTGYYGAQGRVILFFTTLGVLVLVLAALIRWIGQLPLLGQVDEAIDRVRAATEASLQKRSAAQTPGGPGADTAGVAVDSDRTGYVQAVDLGRLEDSAGDLGVKVWIDAMPGAFVHAAQPLLRFSGRANLSTDQVTRLKSAFVIGERRTFDQDPRYGLTVLGQIAAKALSPGVNDPGTASDVIATGVGVLSRWARSAPPETRDALAHVGFAPLAPEDLLQDLFAPVELYGAGDPTIGVELQRAFIALAALEHPDLTEAARRRSATALARASEALTLEDDRRRLAEVARPLRS